VQDHGVLAEPSAFESVVYAGTWLPYPMKPFELVLSVRWVDLVQVRAVAFDMRFTALPLPAGPALEKSFGEVINIITSMQPIPSCNNVVCQRGIMG
jgi:hypothetical protein